MQHQPSDFTYASGEGVVKLAVKVKDSVGFGYGFPVLHYD
jgi:hypothetical protein